MRRTAGLAGPTPGGEVRARSVPESGRRRGGEGQALGHRHRGPRDPDSTARPGCGRAALLHISSSGLPVCRSPRASLLRCRQSHSHSTLGKEEVPWLVLPGLSGLVTVSGRCLGRGSVPARAVWPARALPGASSWGHRQEGAGQTVRTGKRLGERARPRKRPKPRFSLPRHPGAGPHGAEDTDPAPRHRAGGNERLSEGWRQKSSLRVRHWL